MKTILPAKINSVEEAKAFLTELHQNEESFHPEDDAIHIVNWINGEWMSRFTNEEGLMLNKLMSDIYAMPGNNSASDLVFDPCEFLMGLDKAYVLE